jgi:hypothetical protein
MKYEVRHYTFCDGWVNTWATFDEEGNESPTLFESEADAQAAIDDFFTDIEAEIKSGEREADAGFDRDDFMIVAVGLPWFAVGNDGQLHNIGPHTDIETADNYTNRKNISAIWLINPETAQQWRKILEKGLT